MVSEVVGAKLYLTSEERLSWVVHFPLDKILEVSEVAGARRAKQISEAQKAQLRERGLKSGFGSCKKVASN